MNKFYQDLSIGELGESKVIQYLQSKGLQFKGTSLTLYPEQMKYFDLVFQGKYNEILVEVKTDKFINDTFDNNNLVIEMSCSNKPSGITTTKADLWVNYFSNKTIDNLWMIKVDELRKLITKLKKENIEITSGGDYLRTRLFVIPREKYRSYFKIDTI